jgi:hypothetical protein
MICKFGGDIKPKQLSFGIIVKLLDHSHDPLFKRIVFVWHVVFFGV